MTQAFENMLRLFGCGALGKEPETEYCEELSQIRNKALKQEVWDVVYAAVRGKIEKGEVAVPEDVFMQLEKIFMANVATNMRRVEFNLSTVKKLMEEGIRCCVLKGVTVAALYAVPETRISSDMDILIDEKDEEKVCEILKTSGYTVEERAKYDHHRKTHHKIGGLFEVHVKLHSEGTREHILDGKVEYTEDYALNENGIYTMSVNDGLIYLSAHLIKHLINDGIGIRQVMDLLLYMKKYDNEIDWDRYNELMKELRYDKLIAAVKGIGVKYLGMEFEDAMTEGDGFCELLEDMECGGLFGMSDAENSQFFNLYTKRRSGNNALEHSIYRIIKGENNAFRMILPSLKGMKKRFSYVEKCPALLPVAWIHRIIKLSLQQLGMLKQKEGVSSINNRKMKMIEKLGMID